MRSLKADLESLKEDNVKLMDAKLDQEDINELILRNLTDPQKNNGQNYWKEKEKSSMKWKQ